MSRAKHIGKRDVPHPRVKTDCRPVKGPTILDRIIETEDAAAKTDEPAPVRVLPGQRRLF